MFRYVTSRMEYLPRYLSISGTDPGVGAGAGAHPWDLENAIQDTYTIR